MITGSPKDVYGKGPFYDIGPLGLAFIDDGKSLIVGDGGYKDGEECLRVFTVPEAGKPALNYEKDADAKIGPLAPAEGVLGEGNLYALAVTPTALYVTCNGDDTKGWVAKADINGTKFGKLERWLPRRKWSRSMPPSASPSASRATSSSARWAKSTSPRTACSRSTAPRPARC